MTPCSISWRAWSYVIPACALPGAGRTKGSGGAPIRHFRSSDPAISSTCWGVAPRKSGLTFDDAATLGAGPDSPGRTSHRRTRKITLLRYCDTTRVRASEGRANRHAVRAASLAPRTITRAGGHRLEPVRVSKTGDASVMRPAVVARVIRAEVSVGRRWDSPRARDPDCRNGSDGWGPRGRRGGTCFPRKPGLDVELAADSARAAGQEPRGCSASDSSRGPTYRCHRVRSKASATARMCVPMSASSSRTPGASRVPGRVMMAKVS